MTELKPNQNRVAALAVLLAFALGMPGRGQNLVQNGGFESGDFTGWTLSGDTNSVSVATAPLYVNSGTYGAKLKTSGALGFLFQILSTTPGQTYGLSIWLDSSDGAATNEFRVLWNGTNIFDQTNLGAIGWTNLVFTNLAATGTNTTLKFGFRQNPSFLGLDDVVLTNNSPAPVSSAAYTFTTLAGFAGAGNDDGVGGSAQFSGPRAVAVDQSGNIYVMDSGNYTIRQVTSAGVVTTIAGQAGYPGTNDGVGSAARFGAAPTTFNSPGIALDPAGNLYVSDSANNTIRMLTPVGSNWMVSTIAGQPMVSGTNDGIGGAIQFNNPTGLAIDSGTNIYVADRFNYTIRKLSPSGTNWVSSTIAGKIGVSDTADGTNHVARFFGPGGLASDAGGNLYVADYDTVRQVTPVAVSQTTNWVVTTLAGKAGLNGSGFANATGTNAQFGLILNLAVDANTNIYLADYQNDMVRQASPQGTNWQVTTLAGKPFNLKGGSADGTGTNASFNVPYGIAVDGGGEIYVADISNNEIRKITPAGVVTTLAGSATGPGSINGTGIAARFNQPGGIVVDSSGNVYVADSGSDTIRSITTAGIVSTPVGLAGSSGTNDGVGNYARFNQPNGVAVDNAGNLYVADTGNSTIRLVTSAGVVSTIAGLGGMSGTNDGVDMAARFNAPGGVALDRATNIYVADTGNGTIREITRTGAHWMTTTIAGTPGQAGTNDGAGSGALFGGYFPPVPPYFQFIGPQSLTVDSATNIYVVDGGNHSVRRLAQIGTNWVVSTIAKSTATQEGIAVDGSGNLFTANSDDTIQKLTPFGTGSVAATIGGLSGTPGSQDGTGSAARFGSAALAPPQGLATDSSGNLYVADTGNNTIRQGIFTQYAPANPTPYTQPGMNGKLKVTLLPPEAAGQWRFPWEVSWHDSGYIATNLSGGNYPVEFRNLPGWLAIPAQLTDTNPAVVFANGLSQITNYYYPTVLPSDAGASAGSLSVYLGANPPKLAGWRFLGDNNAFFASNFTTNLLPGTYLLEFAGPFNNRVTPANASVQVLSGQLTYISVSYPIAANPPASAQLPVPVPAGEIGDVSDFPFGFNGQLQTDVGYGSGVVVQTNVVLSAAHLVFNDETLSYVNGAYFFLQEEAPAYLPSPQTARGWYLLSGYADQRTNDLSSGDFGPDVSSPQSRNLDVAALYFQSPVAGGGYSGYLPSDAVPNPWLTGAAEKMLVGYPVNGSQYKNSGIVPGQMYQIGPQPYALGLDSESVTNQQEVYTASWFLSYPGNSGGPLYVQLDGYYYPAGVYLGTLNGQSVVRAIDSQVTNLISLAATLGDAGTNNNGGGVITIIPDQLISALNPGYLQVQIGPPSAVQAGAAWLLQPGVNYSTATNFTDVILSTNAVMIQFKPIPGWNVPVNQSLMVTPGNVSQPTALYTVVSPVLAFNAQGLGLTGTTNTTYRIERAASLIGPWTSLSTNTILSNGFNLVAPKTNNPTTTFYRAVWLQR